MKVDFSDIYREIDKGLDEVRQTMERVGEEAVEYAKANGTYQDRTGRLRASNGYEVQDKTLTLFNDAPYAEYVEAKGYDVVSGAALYAEKRLKEEFE